MSVRIEHGTTFLEGHCGVEDAEPLAAALEGDQAGRVNLASCRHLHSAVVQALLAFRPALEGAPDNQFLLRFVMPLLHGHGAAGTEPPSPRAGGQGGIEE